MSYCSDIDLS